ncbi:MAG: hypothetical protein NVSMB60_32350 [Mycobacterium sp.]
MPDVSNWFGDLHSNPSVVTSAANVDDLVAILSDPEHYPSPVRAVGSIHSITQCTAADGGTVVLMRSMDRILRIDAGSVTTEAGSLYIDVSHRLRQHQLQFGVNVELGSLTMGSAATCATKDGSFPGEFGQANSYAIGMKLVTPAGEIVEITEDDPELLQAARSSYGLFGVVFEVTFRVFPLKAMAVRHRTFTIDDFERVLPELWLGDEAVMMYVFPFDDRVTVELRRYQPGLPDRFGWLWKVRNSGHTLAPLVGSFAIRVVPSQRVGFALVDSYHAVMRFTLRFLHADRTAPSDQTIRYPARSGPGRFTFSIWGFPEGKYMSVLRDYVAFCKGHFDKHGYRCDMLNVGYRVAGDQSSLFSYAWGGNVMTLDPVSTAGPGWHEFLAAYNDFCSAHGGAPLLNQTPQLTPAHVRQAFGDRIERFRPYQERFDPDGRMLNDYFRDLLG